MENRWQAIDNFWNSFGIPAYDENSVPDNAIMPYITYNAAVGSIDFPTMLTASVWYWSTTWDEISNKVDNISLYLDSHKLIKVDGGYIFMYKGTPFAQRIGDSKDSVKRVYVNIESEFLMN